MTIFRIFCPEGSANDLVSVGPDSGNVQNRRSASSPVLTFLNSLVNPIFGIFLLDPECVGDRPGGMSPSPTSRLGTGGFLYPCVWPSVLLPLLSQ